jgi:CubicO group peptidase (beta-lactamase class C family)
LIVEYDFSLKGGSNMKTKRLKLFCFFPIVFCFICVAIHAQGKITSPSSKNLRLVIDDMVRDWKIPGLAIAIVKDEKVLLTEGFGLRNIERNLKVTPDTLFPIASCTKTFTAVSIATLVDEGKLKWDIPVKEYVPAINLSDNYAENRITLRDLLAHRSGLPQHYFMYFNRQLSREAIVEWLRFLEPSRGFREAFQYSNLNYMIAAYILEKTTGKTWEDFTQDKIFNPLEMLSSNLSVSESLKSPDYALPYLEEEGTINKTTFLEPDRMGMGPAGSINSNAHDMGNWLLFNLNKGKFKDRQVISEAVLKEIQKPQVVLPGNVSDEVFYSCYGMGWAITSYRGHLQLGHGGGFNGFSCYVSILPRDKIGIAILCNLEGSPVPQILARIICDRLLRLPEFPWNEWIKKNRMKTATSSLQKKGISSQEIKPPRPLEDYCGEFEHPAYGTLSIKNNQNRLSASFHGIVSPLTYLFSDVFEMKDETIGNFRFFFVVTESGAINAIAVPFEPATGKIIFDRIPK